MVDKKVTLLVLSLLFLGIVVSTSCGCIETSSQSTEVSTVFGAASIVKHEFLFGLMESKYDIQVSVLGADVVDIQGIKASELQQILDRYNITL